MATKDVNQMTWAEVKTELRRGSSSARLEQLKTVDAMFTRMMDTPIMRLGKLASEHPELWND
jgi:hypothetical protein